MRIEQKVSLKMQNTRQSWSKQRFALAFLLQRRLFMNFIEKYEGRISRIIAFTIWIVISSWIGSWLMTDILNGDKSILLSFMYDNYKIEQMSVLEKWKFTLLMRVFFIAMTLLAFIIPTVLISIYIQSFEHILDGICLFLVCLLSFFIFTNFGYFLIASIADELPFLQKLTFYFASWFIITHFLYNGYLSIFKKWKNRKREIIE